MYNIKNKTARKIEYTTFFRAEYVRERYRRNLTGIVLKCSVMMKSPMLIVGRQVRIKVKRA